MRKILIIILIAISLSAWGTKYYVATTGNDGTGDGSIGTPWATWQKGFSELSAGDTLYIRGGTYSPSGTAAGGPVAGVYISDSDGTSENPITVLNYPSETPILNGVNITDATTHYGLQLSGCDYWYLKGLTITNVSDSVGDVGWRAIGYMFSGTCTNITIENCISRYNEGPGFAVSGCNALYFLNCDSYGNYDELRGGENADGFVITGGDWTGYSNTYEGCRSWNNSDDGYDTYSYKGIVTYNRCWSFANGYGTAGDGVAFKLGDVTGPPPDLTVRRTLSNCLGFKNRAGIDEGQEGTDGDCVSINIYNNSFYDNYYRNYGFSAHEPTTGLIRIFNNLSYVDGEYGDAIRVDDQLTATANSWQVATVTDADFISVDTTGVSGARQSDGSLPIITFLHLVDGSDLKDAGTAVGVNTDADGTTRGYLPDIGAYEIEDIRLLLINNKMVIVDDTVRTIRK